MNNLLVSILTLTVIGCGGQEPTEPGPILPPPVAWKNVQPAIYAASPMSSANEIAVGENVTILGKDFITPGKGRQSLSVRGTYFAIDGSSHPVNLSYEPQHTSETSLKWRMWPNIVFHPTGDKLGKFVGTLQVTNIGNDGTQLASDAFPLELTVKPSLIPRSLRPTSGCNGLAVVPFTLDGTPMELAVEAVGLRPANADAPLVFTWTFLKEHWDIDMKHFDISFDPEKLFTDDQGPFMLQQKVISGNASSVRDRTSPGFSPEGFLLQIKQDFFEDVSIKKFQTKPLKRDSGQADSYFANISVSVVDATGKTAHLTFPLEVRRIATLEYDNNQHLAERLPPQKVSECIPGGNIGRQVSYREDKSDTKSRDLGFSFNSTAATTLGLPSNPFALALNPSLTFGVDYRASVSSSTSKGLDINGQVLPGLFGMFYRQTTKIHRIAKIWGNTACGQEVDLGEAVLTDWIFAPDMAQGPSCPPASNLPAPQVFR